MLYLQQPCPIALDCPGTLSLPASTKTEDGENYQHDNDCTDDVYDIVHEVYLCLAHYAVAGCAGDS